MQVVYRLYCRHYCHLSVYYSMQVVVVRHDEDISWSDDFAAVRTTLYTSTPPPPPPPRHLHLLHRRLCPLYCRPTASTPSTPTRP